MNRYTKTLFWHRSFQISDVEMINSSVVVGPVDTEEKVEGDKIGTLFYIHSLCMKSSSKA